MSNLNISPSKAEKFGIKIAKDGIFRSAEEILTQKTVNMSKIRDIWHEILDHGKDIDEQIEINSHYRGYLKKQKKLIFWPLKEMKIYLYQITSIMINFQACLMKLRLNLRK